MFLKEAVVLAVVDMLWLFLIGPTYTGMVGKIQGGTPMQARMLYAIPVYLALGYLLSTVKKESLQTAFYLGMSVYAVYDFTVLALFHQYTLPLALADTLWGGILMSAGSYLVKRFAV